jgi:energy-coupling factor transporter ATP-binding protein EcfA2
MAVKKVIIEFVDFGFQYHAQSEPTLFHIDCKIYEGEKVLILGASGSGKSSLAHCINGLIPFFYRGETTGSVRINGIETKSMSLTEISNHVGTVLQDPDGQFVGLTVAEDIAFQLENNGASQQEMLAIVDKVSKMVGMANHLDQVPHVLSGGQKQRVTLAGVMVNDVDILLFDEPLANLDPQTGRSAIELIDDIHRDTGKTIIIIEHRLEDVLHRHIDRVLVVQDGAIIADLAPDELLSSAWLMKIGVREPLYIAALKRAGCEITANMLPSHLQTIRLESHHVDRLHKWKSQAHIQSTSQVRMPLLEMRDVSFAYVPGKPVLNDLSLSLHVAEMICIIGNNGAGKSTISKLFCGFYQPTAGHIELHGEDMSSMTIRERAEHIGYVLQNPNQMISNTMIYEEVAMGLKIRGFAEEDIQKRVHEVLHVCGLYAFRNWPISALSFGQKKRVTIAAILVLRPQVLILDEPTAGQDYKHYQEMMQFIVQLNRQGVAIVMITHDMHLMMEYADRAIVLSAGQVIADDHPTRVLANQAVMEAAHLKETSLHELARKVKFKHPEDLAMRFMEEDRRIRNQ